MKRTETLVELSRRDFCALAGCVGLIATGCTDGGTRIVGTGGLGEKPDASEGEADAAEDSPDASEGAIDAAPGSPDAAPGSPDARPTPDAAPGSPDARPMPDASPPDAGGGPTCNGAATDVGAASSFSSGSPKLFSSGRFFVVRDSGGLYAVSSLCTHQGATNAVSSGVFRCPRHGAEFTFDGDIISGPVFTPLVHYAMCFLSNGNVGVMTSQQVAQGTRLVA